MTEATVVTMTPTAPQTTRDTILRRSAGGDPNLGYYLYLPSTSAARARLMVCVHGISRNAEEQVNTLRNFANHRGYALLAPCFSRQGFRGYQRLATGQAGYTPQAALHRMLTDIAQSFGIDTRRFDLFGYSGGAQFAHRYALMFPQRVASLTVCSAGWYTFPDETLPYPQGLAGFDSLLSPCHSDNAGRLRAFLAIPVQVLVGELDRNWDQALNRSPKINRQQGFHRFDRARRWVNALQASAQQIGLSPRVSLIVLRSCGHSFMACARIGRLADHLFASPAHSARHPSPVDGGLPAAYLAGSEPRSESLPATQA